MVDKLTFIVLDCVLAFVADVVDSVIIGLLLDIVCKVVLAVVTVAFVDVVVIAGLMLGFRVTNVDLTVEVFIIASDEVVDECDGDDVVLRLSSADTTEKVVENSKSSSWSLDVLEGTLIISLVGFGLGRGARVVSTYEIVVNDGGGR